MSEREEHIQEYYETLEYETNQPAISRYIDIFLRNQKAIRENEDARVLLYRGHSDASYKLEPSVFRKNLLRKEHIMTQDLLLKAPEAFFNCSNPFEKLIKMQHYGLPTRLLDVTLNPLVALFFSCVSNSKKDGEIMIFYDYLSHPQDIDVMRMAALAEYSGSSEKQITDFFIKRNLLTARKPDARKRELEQFMGKKRIVVSAPHNNERIKRQHGAFVLFGTEKESGANPYKKTRFVAKNTSEEIDGTVTIPNSEKAELLIELDAMGINWAFLFPELEHQAAYIKSKHEEV